MEARTIKVPLQIIINDGTNIRSLHFKDCESKNEVREYLAICVSLGFAREDGVI